MSQQWKVIVTCPPMQRSINRYGNLLASMSMQVVCPQIVQILSEDELCNLLPDFDGWIIGDDPATKRVFQQGVKGKLRAAVKWGVGIDNVDFPSARQLGINVVNTPGMFGDEVADLAMHYVVGLARETFAVNSGVWNGQWPKPVGVSLRGKTAGVVGLGDIGRAIARRLLVSGVNVIGYDPVAQTEEEFGSLIHRKLWPECLEDLDFLVICCALNQNTHHLLNSVTLGRCKTGLRLVNVSRGPIIDEQALAAALTQGKVHSAALDVFEVEPLPLQSLLRGFRNCIFGSHNGSNTQEAVDRTSEKAIALLNAQLLQEPNRP